MKSCGILDWNRLHAENNATFSWMMWTAWGLGGGQNSKNALFPSPSVWQVRKCKEQTEPLNRSTHLFDWKDHGSPCHGSPLLGKGYLGKTCRIPLIVLVHPLNVWNSIGNKHCNDFFHIKTQRISQYPLKNGRLWKDNPFHLQMDLHGPLFHVTFKSLGFFGRWIFPPGFHRPTVTDLSSHLIETPEYGVSARVRRSFLFIPIGSMYGIFTYVWLIVYGKCR